MRRVVSGAIYTAADRGYIPDDHRQAVFVDIGQHQARLVEGADQVLAPRRIDRRLAADRGIHLRQQGRRNLNEVDAAHVERRRQAGQVAHDTAAQGHDHVLAVQPGLKQPVQHELQLGEGL